ncbi:ATP-dependent RNA helicase A-like [Penaeus japonicus]|uniref:ATP-dependent RNA helicase A-like n=1 Tax=Penaeus japonicus TaxID=27405 RepID=UPI001C711ABA|nr:ATP-dependent RNA helicase A-like [Penaeus japonicus]
MKMLILILMSAAAASADLRGYSFPTPPGPSIDLGGCSDGQVRHVDGKCVTPRENRRVFLYEVPLNTVFSGTPTNIPEPRVDTNILLIRTPDGFLGPDPVVVPPPRQQHVVYVLNKQSEHGQRVIEVTAPPPSNPEVYFVNYAEGENPTLPSGVDLQSALGAASQGDGQVIGDNGDGGVVSGGDGVGSGGTGGTSVSSGLGGSGNFGGSGTFGASSGVFGGGGLGHGSYTPPFPPTNLYTAP